MSDYSLLVVEDDLDLLESFSEWFSRRGFRVTKASHPRQVTPAGTYVTFDAAIIDMRLLDTEVLELIDNLKALSDAPIIALSGDDNPKLLDAAIECGVYRFLLKPVSMRAVEEVIRERLAGDANPSLNEKTTTYSH